MTEETRTGLLNANVTLHERAARAEQRVLALEQLLVSERARADRYKAEAEALYAMLPEHLRPTT